MILKNRIIVSVMLLFIALVSCDSTETPSDGDHSLLGFVPADTVIFGGGLEPWKFEEFSTLTKSFNMDKSINWERIYDKERFNGSAALRMVTGLYVEYFKALSSDDASLKSFGIGDELDLSVYMVGLAPVIRVRTQDQEQFLALIEKIEQERSAQSTMEEIGHTRIRRYSLDKSADKKVEFIVAQQGDFAVFALDSQPGDSNIRSILGIDKPAQSLAHTDKLKTIVNEHGFLPAYLAFIDHIELVNMFGSAEAQHLSKTTGELLSQNNAGNELDFIQSGACQTELREVAELWPKTVLGYTRFETGSKPLVLDGSIIVESTDEEVLADLQTLRGVVPAFNRDHDPAVEFAFGLNIDALSPFINKTMQTLGSKQYKCELLSGMSRSIVGADPGALGMVGLFASGVKGIAISIIELDFEAPGGLDGVNVTNFAGLISLATENPLGLFNTAAAMLPMLQGIDIPTNGNTIDLPVPMLSTPPKLTVKDKYIVAYVGEKARQLTESLNVSNLEPNGIFSSKMNYAAYFDLLMKGLKLGNVAGEISRDELKILESYRDLDASLSTSVDVTGKGIVMKMGMELR